MWWFASKLAKLHQCSSHLLWGPLGGAKPLQIATSKYCPRIKTSSLKVHSCCCSCQHLSRSACLCVIQLNSCMLPLLPVSALVQKATIVPAVAWHERQQLYQHWREGIICISFGVKGIICISFGMEGNISISFGMTGNISISFGMKGNISTSICIKGNNWTAGPARSSLQQLRRRLFCHSVQLA